MTEKSVQMPSGTERHAHTVLQSGRRISWSVIRGVILAGLCFEILYPFFIKLMQAFMSVADLTDPTVKMYPRNWSLDQIERAFSDIRYLPNLLNTLMLALSLALLQTFICTMVGYGFARFKFRLRGFFFTVVIITLIIPMQLYSTSAFIYFQRLGQLGKLTPFFLLGMTGFGMKNGLYIFLMRQFFRGLPKELEDAAYIDGCGMLPTYFRIILPNARNMLITVFTLSFAWQWTDSFFSSLFMINENFQTLPLAVINNIREIATGGERVGAIVFSLRRNIACLLLMIPLLVLYGFLQKRLISGIERSGLVE